MNLLRTHDELVEAGATKPALVVTEGRLPHHRVRVLDLSTNQEVIHELSTLRARISTGELSLRRPGAPQVSPAMQRDPTLDAATNVALEQMRQVRQYSERYDVSINKAYDAVQKKLASNDSQDEAGSNLPSLATIYRRFKAQDEGQPVLCGNANKGNATPRYSEDVDQLIVDNARTLHQQQESRWTIRSLTEYCNQKAHDSKLLPAKKTISRKYVVKVIFTHLTSDADIARLPPQVRAALKAVAKHRIRVDNFLQRVEQDALHLPFWVQTPWGEVGDIYLVHAIDVSTSLPVGWVLSIGSPSASTSLACVERILYSKSDYLASLNVRFDVDPYGSPGCIVFDNGGEAKNERIGGLVRLGIEVQYCKSRHPQHKPYIERLNRALKEALETLPGCTRVDGKDGQRDPIALGDRLMSLKELERWIVRWYFEDWALRSLTRLIRSDIVTGAALGATPVARLQTMEREGRSMPLPPNRDAWMRVKFEQEERTLARTTGITVDTFNFRGSNLARLIAHFGEGEVSVLVDRDDFRTVQVILDDELVPLVNADADESTPALSFADAKAREKAAREAAVIAGAAITGQFRRDVFAASDARTGKHPGKKSTARTPKKNHPKLKQAQAVQKAISSPLRTQADELSHPDQDFSLDEISALPVVDRRTGRAL